MEPLAALDGAARLAVILVNWRGADDSIECLESLLRCPTPMRIILCDNASGDGSIERIQAWARGERDCTPKSPVLAHLTTPPVAKPVPLDLIDRNTAENTRLSDACLTLVQTGGNLGFAGGNNVGLRLALNDPDIEHIWFLNNDTVIEPDAPAAIVRALDADRSIGMAGCAIRYYHRPERFQLVNGARFSRWTGRGYPIGGGAASETGFNADDVAADTDFVSGASLAVTRRFVETVGEMAEDYFLYYEEIDWAVRGRRLFRIGFAPDAVIYHKEGGSIGSSRETAKRSALSEYYMARSKILFGRKHDRMRVPSLLAHNLLLAARRATQGHFDKAAAILKGSFNLPFTNSRQ